MKSMKRLATSLIAVTCLALAPLALAEVDYQKLVDEAHAKYKNNNEGANANYIPILDEVDPNLFGVVIITKDGKTYSAGDVEVGLSTVWRNSDGYRRERSFRLSLGQLVPLRPARRVTLITPR